MQIFQITGAASPRIHVSETYNVFMKGFMSVCICCLVGTAAAMGPGGSSGTGASSGSTGGSVLQPEVVISAIQAYNQGVDLMHAKKFAAARVKFEQAIQANPRFAEAHKNLGFTLSQQGPQNYSKALEHYNKAIQLKPKMAEAYEYRAKLLSRMGRKADAEKDLATLKKLNPKLAGEL
jgi:TolA-binding protein